MDIDGKKLSQKIRGDIAREVAQTQKDIGRAPCLVVILVGEDYGSSIYVKNKAQACEQVGITSHLYTLPEQTGQEELLELIGRLNHDDTIDGILVQLPLPEALDEAAVLDAIDHRKDVDGLHVISSGKLLQGKPTFLPCTPHGMIKMLEELEYDCAGKHAVVIGRSNIVGKPISLLLQRKNATVTMCHSRTKNLPELTRQADILVSAIGKAHFVTADMVKPGAVVLDVGINRGSDGKVTGDVDYEAAKDVAAYITPVPGGVGPMTITMLLHNTLWGAKQYAKK